MREKILQKGILTGVLMLLLTFTVSAQTVVNSIVDMIPYLSQDEVNVKLAPGTYEVVADDFNTDDGIYGNAVINIIGRQSKALFLFSGHNSTYDFTDVIINIDTEIFQRVSGYQFYEVHTIGNGNTVKNLTLIDVGETAPATGAVNLVLDGSHNLIEGFHVTVRGSFPYGYGDVFGKGGGPVIAHDKHSACLIRGESNHVKNCSFIHRAYGHCIFMQAASNPTIEGCYVEGEMRTTDDILLEEGTGSPADEVDFMTTWGYRLPPGYMISLGEAGIRAYNAGETLIDGVNYDRGTSNPTVINCTVKYMRTGVTVAHATGDKYVEGCVALACENGFSLGGGTLKNCSADAVYGPVYRNTYDSDNSYNADITILPPSEEYYNGLGVVAYVGGSDHNLVFRGDPADVNPDLKIMVGGDLQGLRVLHGSNPTQNNLSSSNVVIQNLSGYPMELTDVSSTTTGQTCGEFLDEGTDNDINVEDCETACINESSVEVPSTIESGVRFKYYEGTWDDIPTFSGLDAVKSGSALNIDLSEAAAVDNFALVFNGYINVGNSDSYTFYITSDDYAMLSIDGVEVIAGETSAEDGEKTGWICLDAGYHSILVEYYEQEGSNKLTLAYEGTEITKTTELDLYSVPYSDGENLALDGIASQSSTDFEGSAWRAIDGDLNGELTGGSVTQTETDFDAWWQVDLGKTVAIGEINIYNRTDVCCSSRLGNFTVSILNSEGEEVYSKFVTESPSPSMIVDAFGVEGSIVRILLDDLNILSLAEVEVYKAPNAAITAEIQEDAVGYCAVDGATESTNEGYTGNGYANVDSGRGTGITWNISGEPGNYQFKWRYAMETEATAQLAIDGSNMFDSDLVLTKTSSESDWVEISRTVTVTEAFSEVKLVSTSFGGLPNIDFMEVVGYDFSIQECEQEIEEVLSSEDENSPTGISVYPNHFDDKLQIDLLNANYNQYVIYNINGRIVKRNQIKNDTQALTLNVEKLNRGVYVLVLSGNNSYESVKLIK